MNTVWYAPGEDYPLSREIREEVFVREQEYPIELEFDEADENCWHLVLTDNEKAIATARLLKLSEGVFKPGRIAVLKEYRGKNIGAELLTLIIENILCQKSKRNGSKRASHWSSDLCCRILRKIRIQDNRRRIYGRAHSPH